MTAFMLELTLIRAMEQKYEKLLASEKEYNAKLIVDAVKTKSSMPEHYWQKENTLSNKLKAIKALLEILEEESKC
jgi:hypothetical protein